MQMKKPIYLDFNATTPLAAEVIHTMLTFMKEDFGNPSSTHYYGVKARQGVETARKSVADCIRARVDEIVFTGSGSEANNLAIKGAALANRHKGNHLITSAIEHPAVLVVMHYLENNGFQVTYLPVDQYGLVHPEELEKAITPGTILVSIMHANNEVGTIEPIQKLATLAHQHGVLMHTDAAQSIGKIRVNVQELGVDLLSIAGHKIYAPKGIGALYVRNGVNLEKIIHGAEHELNRRAGTENVIEIAGLGEACQLIIEHLPEYQQHMREMRDELEEGLKQRFDWVRVNGHPDIRLPNTCNVSFKGLEANTILSELVNVAASAGAACHSDRVDLSPVISAMGVPMEYAIGTIRFSVGRTTTKEEIGQALLEIEKVINRLVPGGKDEIKEERTEEIKLTRYTHGLGCACKLRPQLLEKILQDLPVRKDPKVLVGTETGDDAAVYQINAETALVQTIDFFTPIVDDPYTFGAISAANSLSDIYAMGAKPIFALNIVGFPTNRLPLSVLEEILQGGLDKAGEAGISIIGGHTVDDLEPKYGLAVSGIIHPDKIIKNSGARPGDVLILTKPIGTGIISTGLKQGVVSDKKAQLAIESMSTLNRRAAEVMQQVGVNACTDVTGFGLLGHLLGMMKGAKTKAVIHSEVIPFFEGILELVTAGIIPGGTKSNFEYTKPFIHYAGNISQAMKMILNDAQTSGGLLIALPEGKEQEFIQLLLKNGVSTAVKIGEVFKSDNPIIEVDQ
jgi:cysteine desulfurase